MLPLSALRCTLPIPDYEKHRCVFQRSHECLHLPALSWAMEQEPHKKCYIPESGGRFWVTRVSSFSHLSFLALASAWGNPPLVSLLLISHPVGHISFPHSTAWFFSLCKYLLSNYCMVSTKIYSVEEENSKICSFF